ncbi:MAG: LysR family transcriptional regulator [Granulosicoccaceae bacterium]
MKHLQGLKFVDTVARIGSIRKAADTLAITSTALNRRILAMEDELGVAIFERLPRGVRLSAAGELLIHHARTQLADMERLRSQIADLSGVRRGHVSIVCGQALLPYFMVNQIAAYRKLHPGVTFSVMVCDRDEAVDFLASYDADIAVVFEPMRSADFQPVGVVPQSIRALMSPKHVLAKKQSLGWSDLLSTPVILPTRANGVRHLLEEALSRKGGELQPQIESDSFDFIRNYLMNEECISFQIDIGLPSDEKTANFVSREIDQTAMPGGHLFVGQLNGRVLPTAAALFANEIVKALENRYSN